MRYNATLYFRTKQAALDAGYCDAIHDEDETEFPYTAVVTFFCDHVDIEEDDDLFEVVA